MSWYSPPSSQNQAIDLPSGDQAGERSCAATDWVMLRSSPFSAGRVGVEAAAAVGEEVAGAAEPHRVGVVGARLRLRDLVDGIRLVVEDHQPGGLPAAVALPLEKSVADRLVEDARSVR